MLLVIPNMQEKYRNCIKKDNCMTINHDEINIQKDTNNTTRSPNRYCNNIYYSYIYNNNIYYDNVHESYIYYYSNMYIAIVEHALIIYTIVIHNMVI